ncbi:MAG: hypothetical protein ACE15B_17450 [Bryobacteraceae bacterium]
MKALGVIYIVLGALGILGALVVLFFFGGMAALAGSAPDADARYAIPILGGLGVFVFLIVLVMSVPAVIAGIGLLQLRSWARVLGIVMSALNLMNIPIGTAIGLYGLWVLLNRESETLFAR